MFLNHLLFWPTSLVNRQSNLNPTLVKITLESTLWQVAPFRFSHLVDRWTGILSRVHFSCAARGYFTACLHLAERLPFAWAPRGVRLLSVPADSSALPSVPSLDIKSPPLELLAIIAAAHQKTHKALSCSQI